MHDERVYIPYRRTHVRTYYSSFPCAHIHARAQGERQAGMHGTTAPAPAPAVQHRHRRHPHQHRTGLHRCMRCVRPVLLADVRDVQNVRTAPACFTFTAESEHCSDRHAYACSCSYLPMHGSWPVSSGYTHVTRTTAAA
jgi:hypothetical protein